MNARLMSRHITLKSNKQCSSQAGAILAILTIATFSISTLSQPASAHIVADKPWHPVPAAYRSMLFFSNLVPVPWERISNSYEKVHPATATARSAGTFFVGHLASHGTAIRHAIASKDRHALYSSATQGLSVLIRDYIAQARTSLSDQSVARSRVNSSHDANRQPTDER